LRSVGVPLGISVPGQPNIGTTQWRTAYNNGERVLYFDSALTPNTFWVDLDELNITEGAPVMKLSLAGGAVYAGNTSAKFAKAEPFQFLAAQPRR
jgi:choloylglycine hydrolase